MAGSGTPIDRYYIEQFLAEHAGDIRGSVLEVGDDSYSRRFGGDRVLEQHVLHVDENVPGATIIGDLGKADILPAGAFDCIVLTQTLHLIFDMAAALRQLRRSLRPGGVLLLTVPGVSAIDRGEWGESWCWSLTARSLSQLLSQSFAEDDVDVRAFGNLYAATSFLHGAAVEEAGRRKLDRFDAAYPVTIAARAKAGEPA